MAVYKIFAEKDATIYSDYETMNSGLDPVLELTKNTSLLYPSQSSTARMLIKFSDDDILDIKNNYILNKPFSAYLKIYLADSTGLPTDYTVEAYPISGSWDMGTGKYGDVPITSNGVTWKYRGSGMTNQWTTSSFASGSTAYNTIYNPGGGTWYVAAKASQSFGVYTDKDINMDVTNIITSYISSSIPNNGIILKTSGSLEFDKGYNYILNFFSRDTHTVYPPILELKWDDASYNTSGSTASSVVSQDIRVTISNNKEIFNQYEKYRFRLNVRDQFPTRTFATSSIYNQAKYLPTSSYYSIRDVKSDSDVIDFDVNYTKISADTNGNYFDVYMNGLEPERYYKLLIKTVISGSTVVFDDRYFFKVIE
jgi:hypothetical protein